MSRKSSIHLTVSFDKWVGHKKMLRLLNDLSLKRKVKARKNRSEMTSELRTICDRKDGEIVRLKEKAGRVLNVELELQNLRTDYKRLKMYNELLKMRAEKQKDDLAQMLEENERLRTISDSPIKKAAADVNYRERIEYLTAENKRLKQELYKKKDKDQPSNQLGVLADENKGLKEEVSKKESAIRACNSNIAKLTEERNRFVLENTRLIEERRILMQKLKEGTSARAHKASGGCDKISKNNSRLLVLENDEKLARGKDEFKNKPAIYLLEEKNKKLVDEIEVLKEENRSLKNKCSRLEASTLSEKSNKLTGTKEFDKESNELFTINKELKATVEKMNKEKESLKLLLETSGSEIISSSKVAELEETVRSLKMQNNELKQKSLVETNSQSRILAPHLPRESKAMKLNPKGTPTSKAANKDVAQLEAKTKELTEENKKLKETINSVKAANESEIKTLVKKNQALEAELNKLKKEKEVELTSLKEKIELITKANQSFRQEIDSKETDYTTSQSMREVARMLEHSEAEMKLKAIAYLAEQEPTLDTCTSIVASGCLLGLLRIMTGADVHLVSLASNVVISTLHTKPALELFTRCNGVPYTLSLIVLYEFIL
eukprot:TRINITY_DN7778_c0_g1_i7.p1 TRINITY_DN7778_c0_g1~~TRINITY_DN7778_c0_g1_i7.p1  ORF type:complete len:607 (-),score=158.24 TRINITY_DN7778_c0_g1_i7:721-2541(-)